MAVYFVNTGSGNDANSGSSGSPWRTLTAANNKIANGDTVIVMPGVYREALMITKSNTTWQSETRHAAVLEGGWHPGLRKADGTMPVPTSAHLPADKDYGSMILIANGANGVVVDGFTIRNSASTAIAVGDADDVVIRNNRIDWTRHSSIKVNGDKAYAERTLIEGNYCTRAALVRLHTHSNWPGQVNIGKMRKGVIRNNYFGFSMGEGINIHRGSVDCVVEGNVVHTSRMPTLYIQRSVGTVFRNNIVYHLGPVDGIAYGQSSGGIVIGDEAESSPFGFSSDSIIEGNLVVNTRILFNIANNSHNYNTAATNTHIRFNTFVGGPHTADGGGVNIQPNQFGRSHTSSSFTDNIIVGVPSGGYLSAGGGTSGITFARNVWHGTPVSSMRGSGDVYADAQLVNRSASLDPFDVGNYHLMSGSPARGIAAGNLDAGAFQYDTAEPPPPPDPEPEPPPPDPEPEPPTGELTIEISAGSDDGQETAAGSMNTSGISINLTAEGDRIAAIFRDLPIPQGSSVQSAYVAGYIPNGSYGNPHCRIQLQDSGAPESLSGTSGDISKRPVMGDVVTWNATGIGTGWKNTPSLVPLFQALVNRPDWMEGGGAAVIFTGLSSSLLRFQSFEHATGNRPRLYIAFTPPEDEPQPPEPEPTEPPPPTDPNHEESVVIRDWKDGDTYRVYFVHTGDLVLGDDGEIDWEATKHKYIEYRHG